jgi:hypothetical protein
MDTPRSYLPGAGFMDAPGNEKHFKALIEAAPEHIDYMPLEHDSQYDLRRLPPIDAATKRRDAAIRRYDKAIAEAKAVHLDTWGDAFRGAVPYVVIPLLFLAIFWTIGAMDGNGVFDLVGEWFSK